MTHGALMTSRLSLTAPQVSDVSALLRYQSQNLDHFAASSPLRDKTTWLTKEACLGRIQQQSQEWACGAAAHWLVRRVGDTAGAVIGHVSITGIMRGPFQAAYLGYGIDTAHCRQGLATEALGAVVAYAFGVLNLHRIMANHLPENLASARVLDRLGFVTEGAARDYLLLNGRWCDHVLTSLTNHAWSAKQ